MTHGIGRARRYSAALRRTADVWDGPANFVAAPGFRAVAHDRHGGGRSSRPWDGNDLDHYADDLAAVIDELDLTDIVLVGHSTGGGEVTRHVGRHGIDRVAKMVLPGAIPPLMLRTDANPEGPPIEPFDQIRDAVLADRSQFCRDVALPFYGANREGSNVSQGAIVSGHSPKRTSPRT